VPLIVHWPGGIEEAGGLRDQFHHVNDLVPTVYDALGVEAPAVYHGYEQIPVAGVSLRYSFDDPAAASHKEVQYFEMMGHRAIYLDGWKAVTRHRPGVPFEDDKWELYHLAEDRSECTDLAADQPERLAQLVERWWAEAEEYGVLPLDDRSIELFSTRYRDRSPHPTDRRYSYFPPMSPLPAQVAPSLGGRGWDMSATIQRPAGAEGVLYSSGTENSGVSLFVQDDRLVFDYNCFGDHHVAVSEATVPTGDTVVGVEFRRSGQSGDVTLMVDGRPSGKLVVPFAMTMISSVGPSIGYDHGSPVSDRYTGHFPFEGVLHRLDVTLVRGGDGPRVDPAAEERSAMSRQ
jgi:arylsulfatase